MICTNCRRRLRSDAISCICGKFGQESQVRSVPIQCCFAGCPEASICRIFTATGWANVCKTHYPQVKESQKSYAYNSPTAVEMREGYQRSFLRRRLDGGQAVPGTIGVIVPRQPGEDPVEPALGIKVDDLERELAERANP